MQALAIDDEPEPFWDGHDAPDRVERWRERIGWLPTWGRVVAPARTLNGPSGNWVESNLLAALGCLRPDAWITDCLDTYRASTGMTSAVADVYAPFARTVGLATADLAPHPSESQIVTEAVRGHLDRLRREIDTCRPDVVVTLGNAALRVLRRLLDHGPSLSKLAAGDEYGVRLPVRLHGRRCTWIPLAHPAAPKPYQLAHERWLAAEAADR